MKDLGASWDEVTSDFRLRKGADSEHLVKLYFELLS